MCHLKICFFELKEFEKQQVQQGSSISRCLPEARREKCHVGAALLTPGRRRTLLTRVGNGRQQICTNRSCQSNSNLSFGPRVFQSLFLKGLSLFSPLCGQWGFAPSLGLHFFCGGLTAMEQLLYFSPANLSSVSLTPMPSSPLTHLVGPPTRPPSVHRALYLAGDVGDGGDQQLHTHHTPIYGRWWRRKDSQDLTLGLKLPFWRERWGAWKAVESRGDPWEGRGRAVPGRGLDTQDAWAVFF